MAAENSARLRYNLLAGVGGIGTGMFFLLEGDHTLGRNESRPASLLPVRDYCKLHIISHYVAVLLGADLAAGDFRILPVGKVGDDQPATAMRKEMGQVGMDTQFVQTVADRPTLMSVCFQYPDGAGGNITTSQSAAAMLTARDVERIEPIILAAGAKAIALAAPEVTLEARLALLKLAGRCGAFRVAVITPAEADQARQMGMFSATDLLAVNEDEAAAITGQAFDAGKTDAFLAALAESLTAEAPGMEIIFTAGPRGAWAYAAGRWDHCPAIDSDVASTAGAGDSLLGGVIAGLAGSLPLTSPGPGRKSITDRPLQSALDLGVLLAAMTVTSPHTIHPDTGAESLRQFAGRCGLAMSDNMRELLSR